MATDNSNKNHSGQDGEKENLDFTFSDIPILGPDTKGKRDAFSFESFQQQQVAKPGNKNDHISSFTKILQTPSSPKQAESNEEPLNSTQPLDEEYIEQQRQKWEKAVKAKKHSEERPSQKMLIAGASLIGGLLLLVLAALFLLNTLRPSKTEQAAPPAPPSPRGQPSNTTPTPPPPPSPSVPPPEEKPTTPVPPPDSPPVPIPLANDKSPVPESSATQTPPEDPSKKSPEDYLEELEALFAPPQEPQKNAKGKGKEDKTEKQPELKEQVGALCSEIFAAYPNKLDLHRKIQELLRQKNQSPLMLDIYGKWVADNSDSASANYLYGKIMDNPVETLLYMKRAITLNPFFQEAYLEIADYYTKEREWTAVAATYAECMKNAPTAKMRFQQTLAEIRAGQKEKAILSYEKYLSGKKSSDMALRLLEAAQHLQSPALAEKYLDELRNEPAFETEAYRCALKQKALYGTLSEADFEGFFPPELRLYQILYFLTRDMTTKVLMMPTPQAEFPDFWKVFVSWREDDPSWKPNAEKLVEKYRNSPDKTYSLIASVWLGSLKPEEARNMTRDVSPEREPLFFLMLAEYYKRNKNMAAAKVMYGKALDTQELNPYKSLIEHYMKK
ncbi:MAG: hypothetical protein A2X49_11010 [Lentisphaerae bacterium GWF2_52_8]|nr:MAG: hypothetical protein A2X49_11010 [Lentisphaerae bacterium GWF2_52_8]